MNPSEIKKIRKTYIFTLIVGFLLIVASFAGFYVGLSQFNKEILLVLTFHGVKPDPSHPWELTMEKLEGFIHDLQVNGFSSLPAEEFANWYKSDSNQGKKFLITFDDGLKTSGNAIKSLKEKRNINSALFLITDEVGKPGYLTWDEISELVSSYSVKIGLHGKRHLEVSKILAENTDLLAEIDFAKKEIEEKLNTPVNWYAYPFGDYNASSASLLASSSFDFCFTVDGQEVLKIDPKHLIPRIMYLNGAKAAGAADPSDFTPPRSKSVGSLTITLSSLVMFIGISWILRSISLMNIYNKNKSILNEDKKE